MSRSISRHRLLSFTLAGLLGTLATQLFAGPQPAEAFAPSRLLAGNSHSHQSITEQVIEEADRAFFRVSTLTKNMRKARDEIVKANKAVDEDQFSSAKHVDGENFAGAQALILDHLASTIAGLKQGKAELARMHFGSALHTIQDFYAHSNWVELHNTKPNLDLYYPGRPVGKKIAGPTEPTCIGTNMITRKLTSGYYGGEDRRPAIPGKCRHGGPFDKGPGIGGINKDSRMKELSPHWMLHDKAAELATLATRQFLDAIKAVITQKQLRLLLGAGPVLGMAIDTTGSMDEIINGVKDTAIKLVNDRIGTEEEPIRYVLAPFNDPGAGPAFTTDDPRKFSRAISSLSAGGGDDCPEMSMNGALQALGEIDEGGSLFLFTDAGSKDGDLASAVLLLAKRKDIALYPMVFGTCSPLDPAYTRMAKETGGQLFFLNRSDADTATHFADGVVRSDQVTLLSAEGDAPVDGRTYEVPVDSSLRSITFSVTGTRNVQITRPDGTEVEDSDPGVEVIDLSSIDISAEVWRVAQPQTGAWTVRIGGPVAFTFAASGESSLDLSSFRFLQPAGRLGHDDLTEIPGLPPMGQSLTTHAVITDDLLSPQFELRKPDGSPMQILAMTAVTAHDFTTQLTPPTDPFLAYLVAKDSIGNPVSRALRAPLRAQPVVVTPPSAKPVRPGQVVTFTFQVQNLGAADTFVFAAGDDHGSSFTVSPRSLKLPANIARSAHTVTITAKVACSIGAPALQHLVVSAQSRSRADVFNAAVLTNTVNGKPSAHCALPNTGSRVTPVAETGLAFLLLGGLLIGVARRRTA